MKMFWCVAWLIGCSADPTTEVFDPDAVVTGIYTITATRVDDVCAPPRFEGTGYVGLFTAVEGLQLYDYRDTSAGPLVDEYGLLKADGYALRIPADGEHLDPCAAVPGGSVVFDYTLTAASADRVEVAEDETWTLVGPCPSPVGVGASEAPTSSCHASRTLRYDLVQACAPPCAVRTGNGPGGYACTCGP